MRAAIRAAMASDWFVRLAGRGRVEGSRCEPRSARSRPRSSTSAWRGCPRSSRWSRPRARAFAEANLVAAELRPEPMAEVIDTTRRRTSAIPVRIYVPHDAGPELDRLVPRRRRRDRIDRGSEPVTATSPRRPVHRRVGRLPARPRGQHPAAIDDACAAWEALVARVPTGGRVAVGGDSFGGFLSAHVDRDARERRAAARSPGAGLSAAST